MTLTYFAKRVSYSAVRVKRDYYVFIQHVRDISSSAHRVNVYHLTVDVMPTVTVMTAAMSSIAVS